MPLNASSDFDKVVVDFNPTSLGIDSITAYREVDGTTPDAPSTWTAVQTLPRFARTNGAPLPGIYNASEVSFVECVKRIRAKTVKLYYTFENFTEISVEDAEGNSSKIFGHILDHDPIYREIKRQEAAEAPPSFLIPIDKIFYKYDDADDPDLPTTTLTNNDFQAHMEAVNAQGWYPSDKYAKTDAISPSNKQHKCLVTYYIQGASYYVEVMRIETLHVKTRDFDGEIPIRLDESS